MASPRQALGAYFRTLVDFVQEKGLAEQVLPHLSEATRALTSKPPSPLSWMDSTAVDELQTALGAVGGKDVLVEYGARQARAFGGSMIQPVIRAAFLLFGETPAAAFANLDNFFTLATRGISFRWQKLGEREGIVEARFAGPDTPPSAFHVLQGSLRFVFEISGAKDGEVDPAEVVSADPAASVVRYRVRWR